MNGKIKWDCDVNADGSASCQRQKTHRPETMAIYRRTAYGMTSIVRLCEDHVINWESKHYNCQPVPVCPQCFEEH
jgi:hypothetical protein